MCKDGAWRQPRDTEAKGERERERAHRGARVRTPYRLVTHEDVHGLRQDGRLEARDLARDRRDAPRLRVRAKRRRVVQVEAVPDLVERRHTPFARRIQISLAEKVDAIGRVEKVARGGLRLGLPFRVGDENLGLLFGRL